MIRMMSFLLKIVEPNYLFYGRKNVSADINILSNFDFDHYIRQNTQSLGRINDAFNFV